MFASTFGQIVVTGHPVQLTEGATGVVPMQSGIIQCSALWGRSPGGASLAPPAKLYATVER